MSRMGRIPVRKKAWAALAAGAGIGAWCAHRDKKYPIRKELRFVNKLAVPGWAVNLETAKLANRALDRMALMPPALPQGVERFGIQFFAADGTPVRLTIYRPEGLDWAAPLPGVLPRRRVLRPRRGLHPPLCRPVRPGCAVRGGVRPLPHGGRRPLPHTF